MKSEMRETAGGGVDSERGERGDGADQHEQPGRRERGGSEDVPGREAQPEGVRAADEEVRH